MGISLTLVGSILEIPISKHTFNWFTDTGDVVHGHWRCGGHLADAGWIHSEDPVRAFRRSEWGSWNDYGPAMESDAALSMGWDGHGGGGTNTGTRHSARIEVTHTPGPETRESGVGRSAGHYCKITTSFAC